jgi:long-chain acyl-CoA synthetase
MVTYDKDESLNSLLVHHFVLAVKVAYATITRSGRLPISGTGEATMRGVDAVLGDAGLRLGDLLAEQARARPDAPALVAGGLSWTYAELAARADAAARFLAARGVRAGDRVMVVQENAPAAIALFFGALALDAWAAPVNARLTAHEVAAITGLCVPRLVVHLPGLSAQAAAHAAGAERIAHPELGALAVEGPLPAAPEGAGLPAAEQVAALVFTSGSTGRPKAVMLTHRNMAFNAAVVARERRYAPADRVYGIAPLTHSLGLGAILLPTLYAGGVFEVVQRLDLRDLADAVTRRGVTVLNGPPALYVRIMEHAGRDGGVDLRRTGLRLLGVGSAPLDPALKRRIEDAFGLPLHNGYGVTEAGPSIAFSRPGDPAPGLSVGPPLPFVEARVADPDCREVPRRAEGELLVRGPGVMLGYYRDPEATAAAFAPGPGRWLRTGDVAAQDVAGNLSILGRSKELIIRGGFNVYPAEIENLLNAQAGVALSAVVGREAGSDEEIVAFVEPRPGGTPPDPAGLAAALAERLAPYKRPSRIVLVEQLPTSPTGKVLKGRLAEPGR